MHVFEYLTTARLQLTFRLLVCGFAMSAVLMAERVDAQSQRLYAIRGSTVAELDTGLTHFVSVLRAWTLPQSLIGEAVSVGAGRYLVSTGTGSSTMHVFDTVTGTLTTAPVPTPFSSLAFVAANPTTDDLLFVGRTSPPDRIGLVTWNPLTGSVSARDVPGSCPAAWAYAHKAGTVFVVQRSECGPLPARTSWVDAIDLATGQIRPHSFEVPPASIKASPPTSRARGCG